MAIALSRQDYWDLFVEGEVNADGPLAPEPWEQTWQYPADLGHGYQRTIQLREGIEVAIAHYQLRDDLILRFPSRPHSLEYCFYVSGYQQCNGIDEPPGRYALCGNGMAPEEVTYLSAAQPFLAINIHIEPALWQSWGEELSSSMHSLVCDRNTLYPVHYGTTTAEISGVLQQILACPYQGLTKRLFLESKVLELTAFIAAALQPDPSLLLPPGLSADTVDCLYQARQILLERLAQPPTLLELARQVGLNDCSLKRGFRQVFGTTVFGYLHQQRMVKAQQLLSQGHMNVQEAARAVGYASRSNFATAFRHMFGLNPSAYRAQHKSSR